MRVTRKMSASSDTFAIVSAVTAATLASISPIMPSMVNGADAWPVALRILLFPGSNTSRNASSSRLRSASPV